MENKVYELENATIHYEIGFEADSIYCHLIKRLDETPLNQVSKVVIKKTSLGTGEELSFRIHYLKNGGEKKFPWIQAKVTSPTTQEFLEDLKSRLPANVIWEDRRTTGKVKDDSGNTVYDLQYLPFGYAGAGLSRTLQIWIYLIFTTVLVFPLIYHIYLLSTGGYRIYTSESGINIRKASSTYFAWDGIEKVYMTKINVVDRDNRTNTNVLKIQFSEQGMHKAFIMRYDHALPFLNELLEKNVVSEEEIAPFR